MIQSKCLLTARQIKKSPCLKQIFLLVTLSLLSPTLHAMCPTATPWSTPINLSTTAGVGAVGSGVFSASTSAGFMAVWADVSNNAYYSFSSNGATWQSGTIPPAAADVASSSDVFVAGNAAGFVVTWVDNSNNAFSSFSTDNGATWSAKISINNTLQLSADVYVAGGASGFVATMIGKNDSNAYVSFSTGTSAWSSPMQVTFDGSVSNQNQNSQTGRGFVSAAVVGNSCMLGWLNGTTDETDSAYFDTINPFSSTAVFPINPIGFFESVPIVSEENGHFVVVARANQGAAGQTYFTTGTSSSSWATSASTPDNPGAGPWVAANQAGFMSSWIVGAGESYPGSPVWTLSNDNGVTWTPVCYILQMESTSISGPIGLSSNSQGFVATWFDTNDSNAYASFYKTLSPTPSPSGDLFVQQLQQKYGPLL